MYDYHLHSSYSGDCNEKMEETIKAAIKMGGKELCFTDHLDYDYPTDEVNFDFDKVKFSKELLLMQEKYDGKLKIKKGIELGLQRHLSKEYNGFLETFDPDFVLCSFHVAQRKDLYNGDFYKDKTPEEAWQVYYEEVLETLKVFKNYSVVGHLDIPKRYNEAVKALDFQISKGYLEKVLDLIIKDNRGIEVNMSGLRTEQKETLPSREILECYFNKGGKIITIGSDAHVKEAIYSHFYEVLNVLKDIGFEHIATYEKMVPKFLSIDDLLNNK